MSLLHYLPMLVYLLFATAALAITVAVIRFLLAATRLLNRKADALEIEIRSGEGSRGG